MWAFGKERPLQTLLSSFSGTSLLRGGLVYVSSPWAVSDKLGIGGDGQHRQQWDPQMLPSHGILALRWLTKGGKKTKKILLLLFSTLGLQITQKSEDPQEHFGT